MSKLEHWHKTISRQDDCDLDIVAILQDQQEQASQRGMSRPFLALASDNKDYWVKTIDVPLSGRLLATEQIVSRCGTLIDAPVCKVNLINIPEEFDAHTLSNGRILKQGIAHASLDIGPAIFNKSLGPEYREYDDNTYRHGFIHAMHDWCWGDDLQWLYQIATDMMTFSHDHGLFLPKVRASPVWSVEALQQSFDEPCELQAELSGITPLALLEAAENLDNVKRSDLRAIISSVPASWDIADTDLEHLGYFLECRASKVADRLRITAANLEED